MRALYLAVCAIALWPASSTAGDEYFLLMFGSQRIPNQPNHSHSFATFVKACRPDGPCTPGAPVTLESDTISWLPETQEVRIGALLREPGHNFELHETICWALKDDQRVSLWGPYRIDPELYGRAMMQISLLNSGTVNYKALDTGHRPDHVANCIHAVGSVSNGWRRRIASPGWGETASFDLLRSFNPWIIDRDHTEQWVASALCLDKYPIIYRDWGNPHSNSIIGPGFRVFGGEAQIRPSYGAPSGARELIPPPRSPERIPPPRN
jgi:hypothetical protein